MGNWTSLSQTGSEKGSNVSVRAGLELFHSLSMLKLSTKPLKSSLRLTLSCNTRLLLPFRDWAIALLLALAHYRSHNTEPNMGKPVAGGMVWRQFFAGENIEERGGQVSAGNCGRNPGQVVDPQNGDKFTWYVNGTA